jgi:23S rRNA pseudouridine1911/1915/1917 synthase
VRVNGQVVRDGRTPVSPGDAVALSAESRPPFPSPLRLVHEDDELLVIEKPAGLLTIASDRERARTAYRLVADYLGRQRPPRRPFIVHRLDRDTSGLLVVAKTPAAKHDLQAQFAARGVERVYVAVVEGRVRDDRGRLESLLTEDRDLRVRATRDQGRLAITHYRVLERRGDVTVLELRLDTGRRQQIRVQLAALGHPVVGDPRHPTGRVTSRRLCLHAVRLGFRHPATGAAVRFDSPVPDVLRRVGAGDRRPR